MTTTPHSASSPDLATLSDHPHHLEPATSPLVADQADSETTQPATPAWQRYFRKIRGGIVVAIGYLLSPLCWWNDLIFNLPIAYAFGALCNLVIPNSLWTGAIVGYWLTNVVGILMMQFGTTDIITNESKPQSFWKTIWTGLASSTAYTIAIVVLVQLGVLNLPDGFGLQN
jgi:hypothetical protein